MQDIRSQVNIFNHQAKSHQHPVFKYYNFPMSRFHPAHNRDYRHVSSQVKNRGGREYYTPSGWVKFALLMTDEDKLAFSSSSCVCFYLADIYVIKSIVETGRFPSQNQVNLGDSSFYTDLNYVYVTPFIDQLSHSGRGVPVPDDHLFSLGSSKTYQVVLQCLVANYSITPIPNQDPIQISRSPSVWSVKSSSLTPYAICIKQI